MFNGNGGYSLADIAAATGDGNGNGWGGNAWWIVILFLICGWGNYGWGGRNGGSTTREEVAYGFDINNLERGISGVQKGICDGFYAMNTSMLNGFGQIQNNMNQGFTGLNNVINTTGHGLEVQLNGIGAQIANCCCTTERALERGFSDLNYNLATQACDTRRAVTDSTRDIIDNQNANTRSILDFLTQDKIATLQAENQNLRFAASQAAQNTYLLNELKQSPVAAYVVPNPYGYNYCGYNNGCNC